MNKLRKTAAQNGTGQPAPSLLRRLVALLVRLVLIGVIIGSAAMISVFWLTHRPQAERRPAQKTARLVTVDRISSGTHQVTVKAMGTVVPAKRIQLTSRVAGRIQEVDPRFVPGGRFEAGGNILEIEKADYELALAQRRTELIRARSELAMEMGRQQVARREYDLLESEVPAEGQDLVLRDPQLRSAQAVVEAAEAAVDQAELNLQRTTVSAPFNTLVQTTSVDLGSQVRDGSVLAELVWTDEYWLEIALPADELRRVDIPGFNSDSGAPVKVFYESAWGRDAFRQGAVKRLMSSIEEAGRMARILVSVGDPLQLATAPAERHPLILGSYVSVEIEGERLEDVIRVPRDALRNGGTVWIMTEDKRLAVRPVTAAWTTRDYVYVQDGLEENDLLVTSDLNAPVEGMKLRVQPGGGERNGREQRRLDVASAPQKTAPPEDRPSTLSAE